MTLLNVLIVGAKLIKSYVGDFDHPRLVFETSTSSRGFVSLSNAGSRFYANFLDFSVI